MTKSKLEYMWVKIPDEIIAWYLYLRLLADKHTLMVIREMYNMYTAIKC